MLLLTMVSGMLSSFTHIIIDGNEDSVTYSGRKCSYCLWSCILSLSLFMKRWIMWKNHRRKPVENALTTYGHHSNYLWSFVMLFNHNIFRSITVKN